MISFDVTSIVITISDVDATDDCGDNWKAFVD